jgi:2-polyprenyl-6-methoxyphenol hydroxylase-like FAD-dependent oxidoreductase
VYTVTRAIIAGGGIVGLTTGRALLRAGMEVLVAEKADAIRAAGATLGLWGNAVSVFDDLNVDVRSVGREAEMYFHGTSGQLLKTPEFGREDHRYLLAHRASLNRLLAESVGYGNIRLEAAVAGFEEDQDSVTVRFSDGSTPRSAGGCRRGSRSSETPRTPCRRTSRRAPPSVSRTWGCCATSSARTPISRPR